MSQPMLSRKLYKTYIFRSPPRQKYPICSIFNHMSINVYTTMVTKPAYHNIQGVLLPPPSEGWQKIQSHTRHPVVRISSRYSRLDSMAFLRVPSLQHLDTSNVILDVNIYFGAKKTHEFWCCRFQLGRCNYSFRASHEAWLHIWHLTSHIWHLTSHIWAFDIPYLGI